MKNYFGWSSRQLYLIFFRPTQFKREFDDHRPVGFQQSFFKSIYYLVVMFPWVVGLAVSGYILGGYFCELIGMRFDWVRSQEAMLLGIGVGLTWGPAAVIAMPVAVAGYGAVSLLVGIMVVPVFVSIVGAARGVSILVASGVAFGTVFGILAGISELIRETSGWTLPHMMAWITLGALGALLSLGAGAALNPSFGIKLCLAFGVIYGVVSQGATGDGMSVVVSSLMHGGALTLGYFRFVAYPFDFTLSLATYLVGRWQPRAVPGAWSWCPVVWNELIWLPLPFASRLLTLLAKQNREEGLRQIAFVVAERKLQRNVAIVALVELAIGDLKAKSLSELPDIAKKMSWTTDTPSGVLPEEVTTSLPRFDRVAQHAGQYLTLHSAYRKSEALDHALAEVAALQRSLSAAQEGYVPRLLQVASEWRRFIDEERKRTKTLAAVWEIPNPFVFGPPVAVTEHNVFTGRSDIVRQIEASVLGARQTPTLLLHGPRRMGKTSILNQLPRLLGPDFAPVMIDCQNPAVTESKVALLRYLSRKCSEVLRRGRVIVEPLQASRLEREPFAVFDEWLDEVESAMPGGMRALLCLDEYERLGATLEAGWGGAFLDALRHTLQHRPRVVLMFTGAHTFGELGPAWTDRFISARRVRVSFLGREDVELLLTEPIREFDMKWAAGALDAVIAATSCQPFLTQAVAFELVQHLNERQRKEATTDDVEAAIGRALVSGGEYFANVWSDAGAEGQAVLRALALGETPPEAALARVWLREHDVLDDGGRFAVEMVRRWVVSKTT